MKSRRAARAGFTLIELMVVIVIVGLLIAASAYVLVGRADKAKVETTKFAISEIEKGLEEFKLNHNVYPQKLEDMVHQPSYVDAAAWPRGGYLKKNPKDGWGREFIFRQPGTNGQPYDLISLGQDGREGGEGLDKDIWNHEAAQR